ncbi:hypothetical protein [Bosea rubneri]|uniref:Ribbon-helix-helix protein CopG domain-containing protein n=1 Tax=Bosea rubneri TaxID=3075434 RepID=A0ABU3S4D0_9HYPH|nr:hypothetical protein [Bosea sp. ZW T0_25]MDU0339566.1 hypothetical protein [Bosea sp. ZW T0_25]
MMKQPTEPRKSPDLIRLQVHVPSESLSLIEAFRKRAGSSSRARAVKTLIMKGLTQEAGS